MNGFGPNAEYKGKLEYHWELIHEEFRDFYSSPCSIKEFEEDFQSKEK